MNLLDAIILGIVEGLTEFLPVSSTGHLILTAHMLGLQHTQFLKSFEISIQLGAILAVLTIYREKLTRDLEIWKRITVAFIPTAIVGFTLYRFIKGYLIGNDKVVVFTLFLGGILLILVDRLWGERPKYTDVNSMPLWKCALIGVFQSLAVVPGVSRSGATISGGLILGLSRRSSAEFSFLLAVPTMMAATGYDLLKTGGEFSPDQWKLLAGGFITSFLTAVLSVKMFLRFLNRFGFTPFGVYRMAVALLYGLIFL